MRIAFVSSHINKSLQWLWFTKSLKNTNKIEKIIHIVFYEQNTEIPIIVTDLLEEGIMVYSMPISGLISKFRAINFCISIFKKHKIDIVHTTLPYGNLFGQIAAFYLGIKKRITTCENASWADDNESRNQKLIDKLTFKLSKKIIAVADSAYEYLSLKLNISENKLIKIYHGLEENEYLTISKVRVDKLRKQLSLQQNDFIVGMISRLELWKGHEYAIKAMINFKEKHPNIKLYIFGSEGKDKEYILNLIKELKLENTVKYKGFINDPIALFQLFDIHLHVPINKYVENCGISIIEGMISARPQVLTLSGYSAQSARHMYNSVVVDYCNSKEIENAIILLKNNPVLAEKLSKQVKQDALNEYSNSVKTDKHLRLYQDL